MARLDWFWIVVLGIAWGATFFFNEVLLRELGPVTVSAARVGIAAAATWAYVAATGRPATTTGREKRQLALHGMLMYGLPFAIYPMGQQVINSGAAGIINALTPIMIVIVSHVWPGGERATWRKSAGVVSGFGGIVLLSVPALGRGGPSEVGWIAFTMLAPLCYGIAMNYVRRLAGIDRAVMLAWSLSFATLGIGTLALLREGVPGALSGGTVAAMLFLGVVTTSAAFLVFYWLLPRVGATSLSTVTFVAPVSAVLLGALFLDEAVDGWKLSGMAAIFAGLVLIDGRLIRRLAGRPADGQPMG